MARTSWKDPIAHVHGKIYKDEDVVHRTKTFRNSKGQIVRHGPDETFHREPRNYKFKPAVGAEKANLDLNKQAWLQAAAEFQNPERVAYWQQRFDEQSFSPDAEAPIDALTGQRKIYAQPRPFARAIIRQQLLKEAANH